jgi:regulator of protease activity HflC (stomatin/prohibitin superfamily)
MGWLILTLFLTVAAMVGLGFGIEKVQKSYGEDKRMCWSLKRKRVILCVLVPVIACLIGSFSIIPTGYTGVKTTFGQISENTLPAGLNFKAPFFQSIEKVNNKQQDIYFENQIWGESSERTAVYGAQITVSYQINPDKSAWIYANVADYTKNLIPNDLIASAVKSAMVQLDSAKVTQRTSIEPLARDMVTKALNEKYGENVITVLKVTINDMDFEESYKTAIANKQIAAMEKEKQDIENQKAVEKAAADKKVKETNAEAEANATITKAEAQAKANDLLQESLTDDVLYQKWLEKWDGKLPEVAGGDASVIIGELTGQNTSKE